MKLVGNVAALSNRVRTFLLGSGTSDGFLLLDGVLVLSTEYVAKILLLVFGGLGKYVPVVLVGCRVHSTIDTPVSRRKLSLLRTFHTGLSLQYILCSTQVASGEGI